MLAEVIDKKRLLIGFSLSRTEMQAECLLPHQLVKLFCLSPSFSSEKALWNCHHPAQKEKPFITLAFQTAFRQNKFSAASFLRPERKEDLAVTASFQKKKKAGIECDSPFPHHGALRSMRFEPQKMDWSVQYGSGKTNQYFKQKRTCQRYENWKAELKWCPSNQVLIYLLLT